MSQSPTTYETEYTQYTREYAQVKFPDYARATVSEIKDALPEGVQFLGIIYEDLYIEPITYCPRRFYRINISVQ